MLKTSLERRLLIAEDTQRELECALTEAKATIERLESDRRWLAEREQQEREEKEKLEKKWVDERVGPFNLVSRNLFTGLSGPQREHISNAKSLRTSVLESQTGLVNLRDDYEQLKRSSTTTINTHASHLTTARRQVDMIEDELSRARQATRERDKTISDLRSQLEGLEACETRVADESMNAGLASDEHWRIVHEELQRQREQVLAFERLNAQLSMEVKKHRSRNQSVEILMEERRSLERKLAQAEEVKQRAAMLEGELEASRIERQEW